MFDHFIILCMKGLRSLALFTFNLPTHEGEHNLSIYNYSDSWLIAWIANKTPRVLQEPTR